MVAVAVHGGGGGDGGGVVVAVGWRYHVLLQLRTKVVLAWLLLGSCAGPFMGCTFEGALMCTPPDEHWSNYNFE